MVSDMDLIERLSKQIELLQCTIFEIREACRHPKESLTKIPKSSTGGWDRGRDRYWYEFKCSSCGKRWREDQ